MWKIGYCIRLFVYTIIDLVCLLATSSNALNLHFLVHSIQLLGVIYYNYMFLFIVAFAVKFVNGNAVFIATMVSEIFIIFLYFMTSSGSLELGYLWLNPIGALLVVFIAIIVQLLMPKSKAEPEVKA